MALFVEGSFGPGEKEREKELSVSERLRSIAQDLDDLAEDIEVAEELAAEEEEE